MPNLGLKPFVKLYPMLIHKYKDLIVDQNTTEAEKINQIINQLNSLGKLNNDVVRDWNAVYQWIMNDGLATDVSNKLDEMKANGEISELLYNIFDSLTGDMTTLHTDVKDTLVGSINEVDDLAKQNQTNIGNLTELQTGVKDSIVNAINDTATKLAHIALDPKNFGAIGDGVTDDTTAVQNAINALASQSYGSSSGGTLLLSGVYLLSSSLMLNGVINITIQSKTGAKLLLKANQPFGSNNYGTLLQITNCTNIQILNVEFDGNKPNQANCFNADGTLKIASFFRAISITNCTNVKILNCYIHDHCHPAIQVVSPDTTTATMGVTRLIIENCHFYNSFESCQVTQSTSNHIRFINNYCENIGEHGFTTYFGVNDVVVANNIILNTGLETAGTVYGGHGIRLFECVKGVISGNTIENTRFSGICIQENSPASYQDNNEITIIGNVIKTSREDHGINIVNGQNITVIGNSIKDINSNVTGNNQYGINVQQGSKVVVANNNIENCKTYGVAVGTAAATDQVSVQGNVLLNPGQYGVYVHTTGVTNTSVSENNINGKDGRMQYGVWNGVNASRTGIHGNKIMNFTTGDIKDNGVATKHLRAYVRYTQIPTYYASWLQGDYVENTNVTAGSIRGWRVVASGTTGTLAAGITATSSAGATIITLSDVSAINLGDYLNLGGYVRFVTAIDTVNKTITVNASISGDLSGASVSYSPPTWAVDGQSGVMTAITAIPSFIGQVAVVSGIAYMATGTSATTDWKQIS